MKVQKSRGFTLIELLVVIAIIGLLAAIILASLNTARAKGADAAITSDMNSVNSQMEIFNQGGSVGYSGGCAQLGSATPPGAYTILSGAQTTVNGWITSSTVVTAAATAQTYNTVTCHDSQSAWAASAPLHDSTSGSPDFWCVDSTGVAGKRVNVIAANSYVCPAT